MNIKGHFETITRHKLLVMKYCFECGLYRQGLTHDLSKYSPNLTRDREDFSESDDLRSLKEGRVSVRWR